MHIIREYIEVGITWILHIYHEATQSIKQLLWPD